MNCLSRFSREILTNHRGVFYKINSKQATKLAEQFSNEQFANYHRHLCVPFKFYADLEANLKENISKNNPDKSFSDKYQDYIAFGYGYKLLCLMLDLVCLHKYRKLKMRLISLLVKGLKKLSTAKKLRRNTFKKN